MTNKKNLKANGKNKSQLVTTQFKIDVMKGGRN